MGLNTFTYNNHKVAFRDTGDGPALLCIHGFGASTYTWRHIECAFQDRYRIISLDLLGFGLSDRPGNFDYTVQSQSDLVDALVSHLKLEAFTIIGHSYGGAVSMVNCINRLDAAKSSHLKAMILISPAAYHQSFPGFIRLLRTPIIRDIARALCPYNLQAKMILKESFFLNDKITEEMVETYGGYLKRPGSKTALVKTAQNVVPSNFEVLLARYKDIRMPLQLIWGKQDRIVPLKTGEIIHGMIPDSELTILVKCGHIAQEECPEQTIEIISRFLLEI